MTSFNANRIAQTIFILLAAAALKLFYSTATVNDLLWILAPTAFLVELVTARGFEFESHAGYMSADHTFLIAAPCSGVNFLIISFLMLGLGKLWRCHSRNVEWRFVPAAFLAAYFTTIVANTVRISTALRLQGIDSGFGFLKSEDLHRLEGIFIYFGFLLLLFVVSEKMSSDNETGSISSPGLLRRSLLPLTIYYATTLGIPLVNGAYRETTFWQHSIFVIFTPLILILPFTAFCLFRNQRACVLFDRVQE